MGKRRGKGGGGNSDNRPKVEAPEGDNQPAQPRVTTESKILGPGDRLAIALACAAAALALIIYLMDKTTLTVLGALTCTVLFLIYPILHFVQRMLYRVGCFALTLILVSLLGFVEWPVSKETAKVSVADPSYPPSKNKAVRMEGTLEPASSTMCQGMSDEDQIRCFCPSPLSYTLHSLPAPTDNNYSTEIDIKKVKRPIYRLRIFSRAQFQTAGEFIAVPPVENSNGGLALEHMTYDPFSLIIHSTVPKDEFKLEVHSAEGLRLRCINQEN